MGLKNLIGKKVSECRIGGYKAEEERKLRTELAKLKDGKIVFEDDVMTLAEDAEDYAALLKRRADIKREITNLHKHNGEYSDELEPKIEKIDREIDELEDQFEDYSDELRVLKAETPRTSEIKESITNLTESKRDCREQINDLLDKKERLIKKDEKDRERKLKKLETALSETEFALRGLEIPGAMTAATKKSRYELDLTAKIKDIEADRKADKEMAIKDTEAKGKLWGPIGAAAIGVAGTALGAYIKGRSARNLQNDSINAGELPAPKGEPYRML